MTRNSNINKSKWKVLLTLLLISLLCFTLLLATACGKDKEEDKEDAFKAPNFNYSEPDDESTIRNGMFSWAIDNFKFSEMPKTSVSGWSRSSDNLMTPSSSKSGIINVSSNAWEDVADNLYDNSYFYDYFWVMYGMDNERIEAEMKADADWADKAISNSNKKAFFTKKYINSKQAFTDGRINEFKNPGKHSDSADDNVYMLNNYLSKSNVGLGTAQSIKSDSNVTLKKGNYGKITVWVKTQNVSGPYQDGKNCGATIYLSNSIDNESQADFGIFNIIAKEWTQYTLYVKADDVYDTSFSINLGLGYDKLSATEGTVYFDDVEFTELTAEEFANANLTSSVTKTVNFASKDAIKVLNNDVAETVNNETTIKPVVYNLSINDYLKKIAYLEDSGLTANGGYTLSNKTDANGQISGGRFDTNKNTKLETESLNKDAFPYKDNANKVSLVNSSYTLNFGSENSKIKVGPEKYAYVEFYVKNQLSKFNSTTITIDLYDINGKVVKKRPALTTITDTSDEWTKVSLVVKNNFKSGDREFYISAIIGPTDVANSTFVAEYANGTVYITNPTVAYGMIDEYDQNGNKTTNFDIYYFLSTNASATTSLYAGSTSDSNATESKETYDLNVAPSDMGSIEFKPAVLQGYQGIVADHFYVKNDGKERDVNTSKTAGLINTKYLTNYDATLLPDLANKLGFKAGDEDIQPLVIYNPTPDKYGYVGDSQTISAKSKAKIKVTLRVVDSAKAYVYLVDTTDANKEIMTFGDFTANVNAKGEDISNGKQYDGNNLKLFFEITESTMNGEDWITVEFNVATGIKAKDFRVEVWNGGRDSSDETKSKGYVFVSSISVATASAFSEPQSWKEAFTVAGNPLYDVGASEFEASNLILHKQELTDIEKQYNDEYDDDVVYSPKYIWAKNSTFIYAVYSTIEPDVENPYDKIVEEEEEKGGCKKSEEENPASFWLSFSSILLGAVLFLAMLALVVKRIRRKRKANRSDAKSHYKITSRTKGKAKAEKKSWFARIKEKYADDEENEDEETTETAEEELIEEAEAIEEQPESTEEVEQTLDEYVYGEVQVFGDEEKPQTDSEENKEN